MNNTCSRRTGELAREHCQHCRCCRRCLPAACLQRGPVSCTDGGTMLDKSQFTVIKASTGLNRAWMDVRSAWAHVQRLLCFVLPL